MVVHAAPPAVSLRDLSTMAAVRPFNDMNTYDRCYSMVQVYIDVSSWPRLFEFIPSCSSLLSYRVFHCK